MVGRPLDVLKVDSRPRIEFNLDIWTFKNVVIVLNTLVEIEWFSTQKEISTSILIEHDRRIYEDTEVNAQITIVDRLNLSM